VYSQDRAIELSTAGRRPARERVRKESSCPGRMVLLCFPGSYIVAFNALSSCHVVRVNKLWPAALRHAVTCIDDKRVNIQNSVERDVMEKRKVSEYSISVFYSTAHVSPIIPVTTYICYL